MSPDSADAQTTDPMRTDDAESRRSAPRSPSPRATPSRRRFLASGTALVGIAGLAGCTAAPSGDTETGSANERDGDSPDGAADPTPTPGSANVGRPVDEWSGYDPDWEAPATSPLEAELETEVLIRNLEIPWDMAFAPDGTLFITERVGRIRKFDGQEVETVAEPAGAIDAASLAPGSDREPWLITGGEGGTLGIAVHPSYPNPAHAFVYYTYDSGDGKYNKVDVFDVESDDPADPVRTVVDEIAAGTYHNGGRITFGPRNYLWITCGDGLEFGDAQRTDVLAGKILRVTPGGEPAPDNPDLGPDADPRVYTYGHRNPQGIVWLPDGTPTISEHGPGYGGDEFNRLQPGANYGWDVEEKRTRRREEYPDSDVHKPLYNTSGTSFAPTGSLFYTGETVPALRNRMITGGLISEQLVATTITPAGEELPPAEDAYEQVPADTGWSDDAYAATVHTLFEGELGRIRHVEQSPSGDIYVCTSNRDGRASEGFPRDVDDVLVRITQS